MQRVSRRAPQDHKMEAGRIGSALGMEPRSRPYTRRPSTVASLSPGIGSRTSRLPQGRPECLSSRISLKRRAWHYAPFSHLCRDGVFWRAVWELRVDQNDRGATRGTGRWLQMARSIRLEALWLCGRPLGDVPTNSWVDRCWDPLLEADPWPEPQGRSRTPLRRSRGRPQAGRDPQEEPNPERASTLRASTPQERASPFPRHQARAALSAARPASTHKRRRSDRSPQGRPSRKARSRFSSGPQKPYRSLGEHSSTWTKKSDPEAWRTGWSGRWRGPHRGSGEPRSSTSAQRSRAQTAGRQDAGRGGWWAGRQLPEDWGVGQGHRWRRQSWAASPPPIAQSRGAARSSWYGGEPHREAGASWGARGRDWGAGESSRR